MKKYIERIKNDSIEIFKKDYARMIKEYKTETAITNEYNGRQLLELIQNADDAKSNIISITLNKEKHTLSISNNGKPFVKEGYRSLMLSGLSSKIKKTFIGNKGLGFRSIINWTESVRIHSNDLSVEFSDKIRKSTFIKLYSEDVIEKIRNEFSFSHSTIPFPFLAIPEIKDYSNGKFTTTIEIKYKNQDWILMDIIKQVKELKPEVLLFLNNINAIHFVGFDDEIKDIIVDTAKENEKPLRIANKEWTVFEKTGELPPDFRDEYSTEKECYQVKIAIPKNSETIPDVLYTFFPTKVNLEFPFVVHGTFDLDGSRNQLINSNKNKFVLQILIELIIETAKKISCDKTNWAPIALLKYSTRNKVLEELGFYELINNNIKELSLYPCIDGKYRKIKDTLIYNEEFTNFIYERNYTENFENLLLPIDAELKQWLNSIEEFSFYILTDKFVLSYIDLLSVKLRTINDRADLIYIIANNKELQIENSRYSLLINEKKEVINKEKSAFTPPTTKSEDFNLPDYVKIDFINKKLYSKLLDRFELNHNYEKSRELQRKLKLFTNISSFEPASIINKIINESNKKIRNLKDKKHKNVIIRKMIKSLFLNYKDLKETTKPDTSKVQIITKSGKAYNANSLYLSSDYPSGILTEDIFINVFPKNYFVASRKTIGLEKENEYEVEKFLTEFLNVNKLTKYESEVVPENNYESFVFENVKKPNNYSESSISVTKIENIEIILNKINLEKLILWLIKDKYAFQQINNRFNDDSFKYKKTREWYFHNILETKPSYIKYQIITKSPFNFSELFINNQKFNFINDLKIDYNYPLFIKYDITEEEINELLIELGAKESFENFTIERVSKIINELEKRDPKGKNAQKIYKLAFYHFQKNKQILNLKDNSTLFAKKGDEIKYFPIQEVYYTDNITLPQKIIRQYPILNFPKRLGEAQVSQFFGIKTFKDYNIKIINLELNEKLTTEINAYLSEIKPYLLTIRLDEISADNQKQINRESNAIKNLEVKICQSITCLIEEKEVELDDFDFVKVRDEFYINLNSIQKVKELKKNSKFSDIISEIITITFKVNENKAEFRTCFRNEIEDTEYHTITEYGEQLLQEAKELLNMSDYQRNFWETVFSIKGKTLNPKQSLTEQIFLTFNFNINSIINLIDYQFLSSSANIKNIEGIFNKLNIAIIDFNKMSLKKIDLSKFHSEKLKNYFHSNEKLFKSLLWLKLSTNSANQETFLDILSEYEKSDLFINKLSNENRFKFDFNFEYAFKEYIREKFNIEFSEGVKKVNLEAIYKQNKSEYSIKEQDIIEENIKAKSLLFFKGNKDRISSLIKAFIEKDETINEEYSEVLNTEVIDSFSIKTKTINQNEKKKGAYTHNLSSNKKIKKKGNKAEKKVYAKLIELYGVDSVAYKAKEDEGLHYDIRYTKDGRNWIYVEVKSFDSGIFYISRFEKLFGEENKDNYQIWLVKGNELYPIELFKIKDYNIEATEFIVSLDIEKDGEHTTNMTQFV